MLGIIKFRTPILGMEFSFMLYGSQIQIGHDMEDVRTSGEKSDQEVEVGQVCSGWLKLLQICN